MHETLRRYRKDGGRVTVEERHAGLTIYRLAEPIPLEGFRTTGFFVSGAGCQVTVDFLHEARQIAGLFEREGGFPALRTLVKYRQRLAFEESVR